MACQKHVVWVSNEMKAVHLVWSIRVDTRMSLIKLGDIFVEPERNVVTRSGAERRVTAREMDVLAYLIRNPKRVVPRDELLAAVWTDAIVNDEALTLVVSRLRHALSDTPTRSSVIETVPKRGYRLMVDPVEVAHIDRRASSGPSYRAVGVAILVILAIVMTALFTIVRIEYDRLSTAEVETGLAAP